MNEASKCPVTHKIQCIHCNVCFIITFGTACQIPVYSHINPAPILLLLSFQISLSSFHLCLGLPSGLMPPSLVIKILCVFLTFPSILASQLFILLDLIFQLSGNSKTNEDPHYNLL